MARDERGVLERRINYTPLESQKAFHACESRFKGFSGPVGSGKTQALCHEAIKLAYINTGRTGLIGAPTYPMLQDATIRSFVETLEENDLPYTLNKSANTLTMDDCGSKILFRSLEEFERLRGPNLAWFGVDEMTYSPEDAWQRLEARLRDPKARRLCGFGVWTPKGFDWVYRRFRGESVEGYKLVEASPFENHYILDKTPDFYERLKASYGERFYEQEVLGRYLHLKAGQVYYAFARQEHVGDYELDPTEPLLWSWDFNINPMSSIICQKSNDVIYVLDEIVLSTSSTPEVCDEFLERYGRHRAGVVLTGDSSGNASQTATGKSDYEIIREFFQARPGLGGSVRVGRKNPAVRDRINAVNSQLKSAGGERKLFVDRRCRELIQDFEQVSYKPDSGQVDKEKDSKRTHLSDALGYLIWQEATALRFGEQDRRVM